MDKKVLQPQIAGSFITGSYSWAFYLFSQLNLGNYGFCCPKFAENAILNQARHAKCSSGQSCLEAWSFML